MGHEEKETFHCLRCGHTWKRKSRRITPKTCAKCKNTKWNVEKVNGKSRLTFPAKPRDVEENLILIQILENVEKMKRDIEDLKKEKEDKSLIQSIKNLILFWLIFFGSMVKSSEKKKKL